MHFTNNLTGFSINNFRVFKTDTSFEISPITILTGTNSSGKSSFTKALKLLSNSYKKNGLRSLELMDGDLKIGGFDNMKNNLNQSDEIAFDLEIDVVDYDTTFEKYTVQLIYVSRGLKSLKITKDEEIIFYKESDINSKEYSLQQSFIKLSEKIINKVELKKDFDHLSVKDFNLLCSLILSYLENTIKAHSFYEYGFVPPNNNLSVDIFSDLYNSTFEGLKVIGETTSADRVYFDEDTKEAINYTQVNVFSVHPQLKDFLPESFFKSTDDMVKGEYLIKYLDLESLKEMKLIPLDLLKDLFKRFEFIDGVRATQEIVYTKTNSPGLYELLGQYNNSMDIFYSKFKKWVVDDFKLIRLVEGENFTDIFKIKQIPGYGYIISIKRNGQDIGLSGLGYGVTQLLPILLRVAMFPGSIFIIEEPESNLHPALQSKLADFFVESVEALSDFMPAYFNRFIIESHSEYLIRKLQFLTAKQAIKCTASQLYYFNHPDEIPYNEDQIKKININTDGSLTDNFGVGFFDEATSWKFELLKLNNPQKN